MWCYRKPGFKAHLLAELQQQQQSSQFCDTLLLTDGVSVPAHSCILSALSPRISSLSSATTPPAGQSRLLEFRTLRSCTLLHMVTLLYSGEMAGEGEEEKLEAISAAAKLGIHGLVEVTDNSRESGGEDSGSRCAEVGVQTEPLMPDDTLERRGSWRREVRDGSTYLWRHTLPNGEKDSWTQTEELQVQAAPPPQYETIDVAALQSLGQTEPNFLPPPIPYIPVSVVYQADENNQHQLSSTFVDSLHESTAAGSASVAALAQSYFQPSEATVVAANPHSWCAATTPAAGQWEDEQVRHFQGNIPGYINYFLNTDQTVEGPGRQRGRGRRRSAARRAGAGERRARRPQARGRGGGGGRGRGRGGLSQTLDVQEVGASQLHKVFLQRSGRRLNRAGQGGGAVGRMLYMGNRELQKQSGGRQRRRGRGRGWGISYSGEVKEEGAPKRGRRRTTQQVNQDGPVLRTRRARAEQTTSGPFSSPPIGLHNVRVLSNTTPYHQFSPSPSAPPLHHTTALPSPSPPPQEPEHIDRLLEEVMTDLDILPKNSARSPHPQLALAQNRQQDRTLVLLGAGEGCTQVVERGGDGFSSTHGEVPVLETQGEEELGDMLENFLKSFERHLESCTEREEAETAGEICKEPDQPDMVLRKRRRFQNISETPRLQRRSQVQVQQSEGAENLKKRSRPHRRPASVAAPLSTTQAHSGESSATAKPKRTRKRRRYPTLGKRKYRVRQPKTSTDKKPKRIQDRDDKQLRQIPVVKLKRNDPLPAFVALQGHSVGVQIPGQWSSSLSLKPRCDGLSVKIEPQSLKEYPIRSRIKEHRIMPPLDKQPTSTPEPGCSQSATTKKQCLSLLNGESSTTEIQSQSVENHANNEQQQQQQQEETQGPTRRGQKRRAEVTGGGSVGDTLAKKAFFEKMSQLISEKHSKSSTSAESVSRNMATETEKVADVESVSPTCGGDVSQKEGGQEPVLTGNKVRETLRSLRDEEMENGDDPADVRSPGNMEEDVDVVFSSSPVPEPVTITWTESSEDEEDEEVDVVGEKAADCPVTAAFIAVSRGEFVDRQNQVEMVSR